MANGDLELQRLELAVKQLEFNVEKLGARPEPETKASSLRSPTGVAVIGGVMTLLGALLTNLVQGCSNARVQESQQLAALKLDQEKHRSELILKALDTGGDNEKARKNLQFFVDAGLIEDNKKISKLVKAAEEGGTAIPSIGVPGGPREQEIRVFIEQLPKVPDADAAAIAMNALAEWQSVARIPGKRVDTKEDANVVIVRAKEPGALSYAFLGPPTAGNKLEIHISHEYPWKSEELKAALCREFGHVLGLDNTSQPGQLMSNVDSIDKIPHKPADDDIKRVQAIWSTGASAGKGKSTPVSATPSPE